jgi:PDZ domain-containing protein
VSAVRPRRFVSPRWLIAGALIVLVFLALVAFQLNSGAYILLPDRAHPLAGKVKLPGARPDADGGGIYYVDVFERRASLLERVWPGLHDGATIVPANEINPPGISEQQRLASDRHAMTLSQQIAAAVAERALGYPAKIRGGGVHVDGVFADSHAVGRLRSDDVIVSVDGKRVFTRLDLHAIVSKKGVGEPIRLRVRRGRKTFTITVPLASDPMDRTRPVIGILVSPALQVTLPFQVHFDIGNVGGPSAGLAFALELLELRGRDVDHGYRVAATGELAPDGRIVQIGGVEQKTIGARRSHIDVFLVPEDGGNAAEARRYAHGLKIVPVKTFQQALHALATLPPKD